MDLKDKHPDDVCLLCNVPRDQHGDMNHKFSENGELEPLAPKPEPKNTPPQPRRDTQVQEHPFTKSFVALIDVLISKDILTAHEVAYILAGGGDSAGRPRS